jgi:hypothetical protein
VGKFDVRFLKIFYSETTGKFTLAMYFYLGNSFFNTVSVSRYSRPITVTRDPD